MVGCHTTTRHLSTGGTHMQGQWPLYDNARYKRPLEGVHFIKKSGFLLYIRRYVFTICS